MSLVVRDRERLPVVLIAVLPVLALRFGTGFVRFQSRRKRGVRRFRHALIAHGLTREQATRLAQTYHEAGSIRGILRVPFLRPAK